MRMPWIPLLLIAAGGLGGCYGTAVPPPISSPTPPPGLGLTSVGTIRIPIDLPGLLRVYRLTLAEQAHHLPPAKAEQYADAEIALLTSRYTGREEGLKTELTRRLEAMQPRPPRTAPPGQVPPHAFPRDSADEPARSAR